MAHSNVRSTDRSSADAPRPSIASRLRLAILEAAAEGRDLDSLALHLTAGDMDLLKRDRNLPLEDISFTGGEMRYLGVRVVRGGITVSRLRDASEIVDEPEEPAKPVKKVAKKAATPRKKAAA